MITLGGGVTLTIDYTQGLVFIFHARHTVIRCVSMVLSSINADSKRGKKMVALEM